VWRVLVVGYSGDCSSKSCQATDGHVLVTVMARAAGLSPDRQRDLATAVAGAYLSGR